MFYFFKILDELKSSYFCFFILLKRLIVDDKWSNFDQRSIFVGFCLIENLTDNNNFEYEVC